MSDLHEKVAKLEARVGALEKELSTLKPTASMQYLTDSINSVSDINLPANLIDKIMNLDESQQIPILWHYSTKPVMTVKEFLESAAKKGFTLSHSWLPSAGGSFSGTFVKKGGIFHDVKIKGKGNEKSWKMTDIGKFKINKIVSELNSMP